MASVTSSDKAQGLKAQAAFSRRILPGIACLLAAALLAAVSAIIQIARTIDHDALAQERFLAGKAFEAHQRGMSQHVIDNGFWGDAYTNLSKEVNLNWAYDQANLGPSLYDDFGYDAVLVVDAKGETTYSVIRGKLVQVDARQWFGKGLETLLAQAREAVAVEQSTAGLLTAEGHPTMIAAAVMTPGGSDIEEMDGPASILIFADVMEPDWFSI